MWCELGEEEHRASFTCIICYTRLEPEQKRETGCALKCNCCQECLHRSIIAQFNRNTDMSRIRCICQSGDIPEDVIVANVSSKEYERLKRLRLSRKIDMDPNAIWCPNLKCEKDIVKTGRANKLECTHCGKHACFKCQQPWHEGRSCNDT
mmetsp:Transcript_15367/g.19419  ORF Transcript_15367/g.19419 Transcript_15367/m.19419 type:complete len:150 (-) Transcript_15367:235-684(-)